MERVSFDIARQDVADALREQAEAAGHSVAAEVAALVERTYAKPVPDERAARITAMSGRVFVDHLIAMTRPGSDEDAFAPPRSDKVATPFDAD